MKASERLKEVSFYRPNTLLVALGADFRSIFVVFLAVGVSEVSAVQVTGASLERVKIISIFGSPLQKRLRL